MNLLGTLPALGPEWLDPEKLLNNLGPWATWGTAAIVFAECGLFTFFLPGDSLLFTVGLMVGRGNIPEPLWVVCLILFAAAILGNICGYEIGRAVGAPLRSRDGKFIKKKHFDQTEDFFAKYGNKALVLGRFVPIVRTFITVVAGIGKMERSRFYTWSAVGALLWAVGVTVLGFYLGQIEFVRKNIEVALILIVLVSLLPMAYEYWSHKRKNRGVMVPTIEE